MADHPRGTRPMKIVQGRPPNFDAIAAVLPAANGAKVLFCYGKTIYAPGGGPLSPWLIAHEEVHCLQQGDDIEGWWVKYLTDPKFRFTQEVEAHRREWRVWLSSGTRNRAQRRGQMVVIGARLAGPLYGNMVQFSEAREMILAEDPT